MSIDLLPLKLFDTTVILKNGNSMSPIFPKLRIFVRIFSA